MQRNALIALIAIALIAFSAATWFVARTEPAPTAPASVDGAHVITLTPDGFSPAELTIARGETVTFRSTAGKRFWPASDLHPSHLIYAAFDPKEPIAPEGEWSFTFDLPGSWRFHDHLAPYYTGTITVTE